MADSKKYNGSTWEHSLRKLATATDTFTTLPVDIYADGNNATVGLKGNTVQSGTPTPDNPITPEGCGERTENIYNKYNTIEAGNIGTRYGQYVPQDVYSIYNNTDNIIYWGRNDFQSRFEACAPHSTATVDMTTTQGTNYGFFMPYNDASLGDITIVQGSTAPDHYIPYGYKIPILLNSQTINKYLGTEQTVRQIKKLVLTGEEDINQPVTSIYRFSVPDYLREQDNVPICTHYIGVTPVSTAGDVGDKRIAFLISSSGNNYMYIRDSTYTSLANFKTYLQQQYTNGTPVCVWYVLATSQTAVVNEPLMKIGTYADSLTATIPVTAGENTLDVQTTVQPSEVTATFEGWHPITEVHKRENGQWD